MKRKLIFGYRTISAKQLSGPKKFYSLKTPGTVRFILVTGFMTRAGMNMTQMTHRKANSPEHLENGDLFLRYPLKFP